MHRLYRLKYVDFPPFLLIKAASILARVLIFDQYMSFFEKLWKHLRADT